MAPQSEEKEEVCVTFGFLVVPLILIVKLIPEPGDRLVCRDFIGVMRAES